MNRLDAIGLDRQGKHVLLWMCVLISVNQLGFGSIVPVVALYAEDFDVSQTAIGLTIAVYGMARFLVNLPASRVADLFGRRSILAIGGIVTVVGAVLCAVAPTYATFLVARFIAGAGAACVLTGGQIVLADIASPTNRGRVMAIYQGTFIFSVGAGSFPGGWLAHQYGLASPFWANAALAAVVTVVALRFVPETKGLRPDDHPTRAQAAMSFLEQVRLVSRINGFLLVSLLSFTSFAARTGGLFNVVPLLAEDDIGLSPDQIGLGIGMVSIMALALVYPSGALVDRYGRKAVIVPATLLTGVAMLGFGIAGSFAAYLVACLIWSFAGGLSGAAPAAYAADISPRGMTASTMGLYRALSDAGYVVGPLAMGAIADLQSPIVALVIMCAFLVGSGLLFGLRAPETLPGRVVHARAETPASG